jgi:hypothetical protein
MSNARRTKEKQKLPDWACSLFRGARQTSYTQSDVIYVNKRGVPVAHHQKWTLYKKL